MPTRNINLTDHYEQFVLGQVGSGRFKNASEVMRAALHLLEQQNREDEHKLTLLRSLASEGFAELDRGQWIVGGGMEQLTDIIGRIGRRAAEEIENRPAGG